MFASTNYFYCNSYWTPFNNLGKNQEIHFQKVNVGIYSKLNFMYGFNMRFICNGFNNMNPKILF